MWNGPPDISWHNCLLGLNSFVSELDEQPTNGDDDDEDDSEDDDDDDIIETPVGQITLPNGNRIDRASAGALQKPRNDLDQEAKSALKV